MKTINNESTKMEAAESIGKEIEEFKAYIQKVWNNSKPLAKLFRTSSGGYLYDTGTNKIISCVEPIYFLLDCLFSMDGNRWDQVIYLRLIIGYRGYQKKVD